MFNRIVSAGPWHMAPPVTLMAILLAISLPGCDRGPANQATEPSAEQSADQFNAQATVDSGTRASRPGAHGAYDAHASLTPDKHAQVALQHLAEGRTTEAMNTLHQAIAQFPDDADLHGILGSLLLEQDAFTEALNELEMAVKLAPENPLHLTNRAQAYRKFKRDNEALADLNRAIELNNDLLSARFNRGAVAFGKGDFATALADFDHCIALDPHLAAPYFNRAAVYEAMGKRDMAIADIKRFLEIAPSENWKTTAKELLQQWEAATGSAENSDLS